MPALQSMPQLEPHLSTWWEAYSHIDNSRQWGQGFPQPITLVEIEAYARLKDFAQSEIDDLIFYVQYLDGVYLQRLAGRNK